MLSFYVVRMLSVIYLLFEGFWSCENGDAFTVGHKAGFLVDLPTHQEQTEIMVSIVFRVIVGIAFWARIMIG